MARKLDGYAAQRKALEALRNTGRIDMACLASGVSLQTFIRYREDTPIFDNAVLNAIEYYKFKQALQYDSRVRQKGLKLLEEKIDSGEINEHALLKYLFEKDGRLG